MENETIQLKEEIEQLKRKLEVYEKLFTNANTPMFIMEPESTKIVAVNKRAVDVYGYSEEEFIGMNLEMITRDSYTERSIINNLLEKKESKYVIETTHYRKDGSEIFSEVIFLLFEYKNHKTILSINRDITKRKKIEEESKKYLVELKRLNENKDKFFSMISHDLRSPFNSLLLFSEYLLQNVDTLSLKELNEIIGDLHITSQNLFNLVENLLKWSRVQIGKYEFKPVKLSLLEISAFVIELLKGQAKEKNILLNDYLDLNSFVYADKTMLTSIIQNLIANAIKFTPRGGIVEIYSIENDGMIEISVSDTGIGISEDNINKLFKVESTFSTTGTNMETGTGLGLILCKEFISIHGGDIKVRSKFNEGTIFTFTLPKAN